MQKTLHKILLSSLISTLLVTALSCQKQSSPDIARDEIRGTRELQRLEACSKVNFNKGVLLYKNILLLFVCTKWDEKYPSMFASINKMSQASWDQLMTPIDQSFIENQQRRNRFFKNIRELDAKNGLDDLSRVIVALNESNFFDSIKAIFKCVENPTDTACNERKGRIPNKKSLKNIFKIVDFKTETVDNLSRVIKILVKSLGSNQEALRIEINKLRASPLYVVTRLRVVDALAEKIKEGLSDEDRQFLSKILLTGSALKKEPWIYQWIHDAKMNRDNFRDLLEYPVLVNPQFANEFSAVKKLYDDGLACSIRNASNPNELIDFDLKNHLFNYLSTIKNSNQKDFFDYSSANLVGMKMSTEICRELELNKYNLNLNQVLVNFMQFMADKSHYDLAKFLLNQTTIRGDADKSFAENLYLADFFANKIFNAANEFNANITKSSRDIFPITYDILKSFPVEQYLSMGEFIQSAGGAENEVLLKGAADFWIFFNSEEKNFLFNFIDRHFDKDTNYVLLFDFYSKFLDDLNEVQPIFKEAWISTPVKEEMSYLAFEDVMSKLAGKETLEDFKNFFSRDQILKVLEIISNGQSINSIAKEEIQYINSDYYILKTRSEPYKFKVSYNPADDIGYDSQAIIDCIKTFNALDTGLYQLIHKFPSACSKVTNENISLRLFGWLNSVDNTYSKHRSSNAIEDSLLDDKGILSPYMLNGTIALTKTLDNLIGPWRSSVPTHQGFSYLLDSTSYYFNQRKGLSVLGQNLSWIDSFFEVAPDSNVQHRNSLVKIMTREENFSYTQQVFIHLGKILLDYGDWIKSGEYQKSLNRSLGAYDPKNDCTRVVNQVVSPYPCPSKDIVKTFGGDILNYLHNVWEPEQGSPIAMLLKSVKVGEGLDIPLRSNNSQKYRISLAETFRYLYDTSDKSYVLNRQKINFVNDKNETSLEELTTLERVESVIREVRFGNNYLGASFLNAVVHGDNYNSDVSNKKKLLQKCIKLPVVHCGRLMSKDDLRMANNSLEVFDALSDVNNARGLEPKFQFGNYLKTFEQSLVASSSLEAQKVRLIPLGNETLKKHNGKILSDLTVMSAMSNMARVIRDRIGRSRNEFESFIGNEDFKRVDRSLLYGFNLPQAGAAAEKLIKKLKSTPMGESQNLFELGVDWIASLNYEETRLVEDTIARTLLISSYLGSPENVFGVKGPEYKSISKYSNNNMFQLFLAAERIIDYWPILKKYFPGDVKLINVIKPINQFLFFISSKLKVSSDPLQNNTYLALNDFFTVLQTVMFDQLPNSQLGLSDNDSTQGLNLLIETLKIPRLVSSAYDTSRSNYNFINTFYETDGQWFLTAGQNITRVAQSSKVDLSALKDYLAFTSKNLVCFSGEGTCKSNYHYDEPAQLIKFLVKKSDTGQTHLQLLNQKVFLENADQIYQMIDELLPAIIIKEKKPLILIN